MAEFLSFLYLIGTPVLAGTRLVFVAKYLQSAENGIFTTLVYLSSLIILVIVLIWIEMLITALYRSLGEGA
jgi:hypothetical protein